MKVGRRTCYYFLLFIASNLIKLTVMLRVLKQNAMFSVRKFLHNDTLITANNNAFKFKKWTSCPIAELRFNLSSFINDLF